jgi:xanthosine utilization system XapX-like protein
MATEEPARRWFLRPFENPWVGLIVGLVGTLATIGSFIYAVYWRDHPELTYAVAATRARIVVAGQASALRVSHGETAITTDVTAAQIAFWNGGRRAVESSDVLQPVRLLTDPRVPILEARWRHTSREVCALGIDRSLAAAEGELHIPFRILEPQDGGVLQIIYAGSPEVRIRLVGVVRNQSDLRVSQLLDRESLRFRNMALASLAALGVIFFLRLRSRRTLKLPSVDSVGLAFVAGIVAGIVFDILRAALENPAPPFPF